MTGSFSDFDGLTFLHRNDLLASKDNPKLMSLYLGFCLSRALCTYSEEGKRRGETKSFTSLDPLEEIYNAAREDGCYTGVKGMLYMREQETDFKDTNNVHIHFTTYVSVRIYNDSGYLEMSKN